MNSLFYALAFDGVMKFEYLNFDFLENEKSFWSEKNFFSLVSQVLSFRIKNKLAKM